MLPNPTKLFHLQKLNSFLLVMNGVQRIANLAATGAPSNVWMVILHGDSVSLHGAMPSDAPLYHQGLNFVERVDVQQVSQP